MFGGFPKGLIVAVVLLAGICLVVLFNPPHRACTSKIEMLRELQKGKVFPSKGKVLVRSPRVVRAIEACKLGNSPGACFEFFSILRKFNGDLQSFPMECAEELRDVSEIRAVLREGISIMIQIAWGEAPPERGIAPLRQGWLESTDLALFCSLKDLYSRFFGKEELDEFRKSLYSKLPGEAAVFENSECVNCEFRKNAAQVFTPEELWSHTLFSMRCDLYR